MAIQPYIHGIIFAINFSAFNPTVELGAPSWGGGDTSLTSLNGLFDAILAKGDVYHFMWHPQTLYPDINKSYLINHLNHICGHTDVWYVNLGHLYLYHLIQSIDANQTTIVSNSRNVPNNFELFQNYPNPFNPSTNITFNLKSKSAVKIEIFNVLGQKIKNVDLGLMNAGSANQTIDMSRYATGIYFYRLNIVSGEGERFAAMKKMVLLK
jgi:hypothetical protein